MNSGPSSFVVLARKPIGQYAFKRLLEEFGSESISLVVSNDEPEGWWNDSIIFDSAISLGIRTLSSTSSNRDIENAIRDARPTFIISVQHDRIITNETLESARIGAFNLHLAPLPEYRGWHSASHAVLDGSEFFGATCHRMTESLDFGPIVSKQMFRIEPDWDVSSIYISSEQAGRKAFDVLLAQMQIGFIKYSPMDESQARSFKSADLARRIKELSSEPESAELIRRATDFSRRVNADTLNRIL